MALRERLIAASQALLGISTYEAASADRFSYTPTDAAIEAARQANGGNLQKLPHTITRWYMADLESAEHQANGGYLQLAALLMSAARRDGVLSGVLSTRTSGLVRLPKRFRGPPDMIAALQLGTDGVETRSVFDEIFPPSELSTLAADGELLGVGVGELIAVEGRAYPVFCRLDPQYLSYRWNEGRWYYDSVAGPIPITPGDGHWILHTPGGRSAPWQNALWRAVGRAYIRKEHASAHKDAWEGKLAHPARVAYAPSGSVEREKDSFFRQVMGWSINSVFGLSPGYEIKLLESNGRGYDSFCRTIEDQNNEFMVCIAGQTVTTDGGAGFQNSDIHKSIRADLIKATADSLSYTINTQGLPAFVVAMYGEERLAQCPVVEWDVTPPKDRTAEATSLVQVGAAISALTEALARHGRELDVDAVCVRFGVPVRGDANANGTPDLEERGEAPESDDDNTEADSPSLTVVREAA